MTYHRLLNKLKWVNNLVLNPESIPSEDREIKATDTPLIKKLKQISASIQTEKVKTLGEEEFKAMEQNQKVIYDFLDKNLLLKDVDKKKDLTFKLDIIERGIDHLRNDLEHNQTQGRDMERSLESLRNKLERGEKVNDGELIEKVDVIAKLVERRETEYQASIRMKESEYKEIATKLATIKQKAHDRKLDKRGLEKKIENLKAEVKNETNNLLNLKQNYELELEKERDELEKVLRDKRKLEEEAGSYRDLLSKLEKFFNEENQTILWSEIKEVNDMWEGLLRDIENYCFINNDFSSNIIPNEESKNSFREKLYKIKENTFNFFNKNPSSRKKEEVEVIKIVDGIFDSWNRYFFLLEKMYKTKNGFERLSESFENLKKEKEETDKLIAIANSEKELLEKQSLELKEKIKDFSRKLSNYELQLDGKDEELQTKLQEINNKNILIDEKQKLINNYSKETSNFRSQISTLNSQLGTARAEASNATILKSKVYALQSETSSLRSNSIDNYRKVHAPLSLSLVLDDHPNTTRKASLMVWRDGCWSSEGSFAKSRYLHWPNLLRVIHRRAFVAVIVEESLGSFDNL